MNNQHKKDEMRENILKHESVLSKHQQSEEDYVAKAGTSHGLTSIDNPDVTEDDRNFVDATDTDYSKP
jgi:hypothetical protein